MQGRVFTLLQSGAGVMIPLGLVIAGPLADVLGVRIWYLVAGTSMAVMGVTALFVPAIIRLDDEASAKSEEPASIEESAAIPASAT
jgi:DHA3 family macrolide efflux protein-like MFS transporter